MNGELQLKLQSWLDGELPEREARRLAVWVAQNPAAQALVEELRMTKSLLAGNEPPLQVPESREFYWSKIERAIQRSEPVEEAREAIPWWAAWRRYLAPAAAVVLVAGVTLFTVKLIHPSDTDDASRFLDVVENLSEYTESFAFRSQTENMFVVWIHAKEQNQTSEPEADPVDDAFYQ